VEGAVVLTNTAENRFTWALPDGTALVGYGDETPILVHPMGGGEPEAGTETDIGLGSIVQVEGVRDPEGAIAATHIAVLVPSGLSAF
jgi:hypothetical protein